MAENTIDNLSIQVTASADKAASVFDRLASSAGRLRGAASGAAGGLQDMAQGARDAGTETQRAGEQSGSAAPKIRGVGKDAKDAGDKAKKGASGINVFWSALKSVGSVIKNISIKAFQLGMRGIHTAARGAQRALSGLGRMAVSVGKGLVSYIGDGFKSIGQRISGVVKAFSGLARSIGRIAFYRAIRSAIKMVTQGFAEGIANLYQWSLLVDHKFADSMDKLATASLYLKNSLGAMVAPLINALAPAIDLIVNKLVDAINLVNQFFAALTGQSTYTAAKKFGTAWEEAAEKSAGSAVKAAKEIRKTILGFDELNILNGNKDNDTGSGSGTNKPGLDYSSMFENRAVENGIGNFAQRLKDAFNKGDWDTIGSMFAEKLNGLVDGVDWGGLGVKIGNGVNAIVGTYNSFMENVKWFNIGNSLANTINGIFDEVDWAALGRAFSQKLNAIGETILGFASNFKWGDAGKAFGTAIMGLVSNIKWDTLRNAFIVSLNGVIKAIREFMGSFSWGEAGAKFKEQVLKLVDDFPVDDLGDTLAEGLGNALAFMNGVIEDEKFWNRLGAKFALFLNSLFRKTWVWENAGETVNNALNGILTFGQSFLDTFQADTAATNLKKALNKIKWKEIASSTWTLIKSAFSKTGSFLDALLNEDVDSAKSIDDAYEKLMFNNQSFGTKLGKRISEFIGSINWKQFGADIGKGAKALFNTIADFFKEMRTNGTLSTAIKDYFSGLPDDLIDSAVKAGSEFFLALGQAIGASIWEGIKKFFYDPVLQGGDKLKPELFVPESTPTQRMYGGGQSSTGNGVGRQSALSNGASLSNILGLSAGAETLTASVTVNATPGKGMIMPKDTLEIKPIPDTKASTWVELLKMGWSTISDWAYQSKGGDINQYIALAKQGWDTIDRWAAIYKGSKLDQLIGLVRYGWSLISNWSGQYKGGIVNQLIGLVRNGWSYINGWSSQYIGGAVSQNVGLARDGWYSINSWAQNYTNGDVEQGVKLSVTNTNGFVNSIQKTLHSWFPTLFAKGGIITPGGAVSRFANGGVIHAYAGGTSSAHGSLFLAGEAGPEIVGHVGGRTEVLNKSQIASAMYSAVQAAMAPASANFAAAANAMNADNTALDMEMLAEMVRQGVETAMERERDILRQQLDTLRQINAKDTTVEVSTSSVNRAQSRMNRRMGKTIVPVGT